MPHLKKNFLGNIEKCTFTYLLVKWEVVSPNSREGIFNMKLNGRWFPQIVDRESGNLYAIIIILHSLYQIFDPKCGGG